MNRPLTSEVRKAIPLSVKLAVALRMLGFTKEDQVQYDHDPALALRDWDASSGDFIPPQLDPEFIVILTKAGHRTKTSGRAGEGKSTSYGSDAHAIAKLRRVQKDEEAFRAKMLAKGGDELTAERPKAKLRTAGFPKQHTKFRGRSSLGRRS